MAEHRLMRRVEEVAGRLQRVRRLSTRTRIWLLLTVGGMGLLAANWLLPEPLLSPPLTLAVGVVLIICGALLALRSRASAYDAALAVEQRYPDLDSRLVTALAQRPDYEVGGFSFLQSEVISEALLHAQRHDWKDAVPTRALAGARLRQAALLVMCAAAFVGAAVAALRPDSTTAPPAMANDNLEQEGDAYRLKVEPGNTELERGTALLVLARFGGKLPEQVTLVTSAADGTRQETPLSKSLEDPLFGGRIASVTTDLTYHVDFDDRRSEAYRVRVFDYPQLLQADATIQAPDYTGLNVKQIEDVRRVSVVEGSQLTLTCTLNKPVTTARLFDDLGDDLTLVVDEATPNIVRVTWTPQARRTLTLELADEAGRHNKHPPEFVVDVIPNQPPDLKIAFPARDMRVSPLQELPLEAQVWDDFGLKEFGLVYQLPDGQEQTLKLGDGAKPEARVDVAHELSFESFQAQPNELVAYYFYADDVGPDGDARRTMSNMYFAEVRHFDELFRQAGSSGAAASQQQQQQQQQGQGSPAQQLLQLQRQIVTATWNLIRRERGEPSPELPEDAGVIAESQAEALTAGQQLQGSIEDLLSQQYLTEALKQMTTGEELLREAAETPAIDPLGNARLATQAAYSALLKLQAREHLVQQSQSSQSSSSSSGQQQQLQQQLQQLELKNDRNRYESEQQAGQQSDRESMQVLNRLRELARRQGDLNERIKELENALREVQTEDEREEIERQLKRLQEEQQQLLRDLEETQERMEQPQNRSEMADARQQLEQTREHLRETKEALEAGQVSKALAEGTRAERELEELKEEYRDEAAGQFQERMRDLRDQTRELASNQQELSQQLGGDPAEPTEHQQGDRRPSLRDEKPAGKDLQESLAEQQQQLSEIMQQAEEIVRESETSEPLLSKKLYDTVRDTRVDQPQESLTMTRQFLRLGLDREAVQAEQEARRGIEKLQEGVEQAAESVLGNEAEAIERARNELDDLSRSIASELAQADPRFAEQQRQAEESQRSRAEGRSSDEQRESGRPGEQPRDDEMTEQERTGEQQGQSGRGNPQRDDQQARLGQGQQPSTQTGDRQQSSEQASPGEQSSQRQGQQSGQSQQPQQSDSSEGQPGRSDSPSEQQGQGRSTQGQATQGQQPDQSQQGSQSPGQQTGQGGQRGDTDQDNPLSAFLTRGGTDAGGGNTGPHLGPQRPLTSSEFVEWSDRMRDVEEMLDDPDLRADVARIRDRAREMRIDVKRHSKQPNWELVRTSIYGPMLELQDRLAEELSRLDSDSEEIVPLDRDPVPARYSELVRQYYERLGAGR